MSQGVAETFAMVDLARIPEIGPDHARVLSEAGVRTAADLAALSDVHDLSRRTGLGLATLDAYRAAAWGLMEGLLEKAGVRGLDELARADLGPLAEATGIPRERLATFQAAARDRTAAAAPAPAPRDRVILSEGRATARVSLGGALHEGLAIVTLRMEEDEAAVLERVPADAVLLKERAATAPARIGGALHRDLPIYKEQPRAVVDDAGGSAVEEVRVRVREIKDQRPRGTPAAPTPAPAEERAPEAPPASPAEAPAAKPKKKGFSLFRRGK